MVTDLPEPVSSLSVERLVAEPAFGKRVDVMAAVGSRLEHVGDQHRVVIRCDLDAVPAHHDKIVFQVLHHLEDRLVLQ